MAYGNHSGDYSGQTIGSDAAGVVAGGVPGGGEEDQGGIALVGTDHDKRGRLWELYAEIGPQGEILGGFTEVERQAIYIGEFERAEAIFNGGTHQ